MLVRAVREDRGRFARIAGARVLVYWPHGLGDWVGLGAIAPLLDPSNAYAVTRIGDDYVTVMEGNPYLQPLLGGVRPIGDGAERGGRHFGLRLADCSGRAVQPALPPTLQQAVERFAPDVLLWTDYPETEGRTAYPFHTKARNLARLLVSSARLRTFDLSKPLNNTIDFSAGAAVQRAVDERLAGAAPSGTRWCAISRAGITAARKNWGDGSEARAFVAAMRAGGARWHFVSMEDEELGDGSIGFRALVGNLDEPFARLYKALAARLDLFVGVPAGPLHLTMARGGVPIVGLWVAHHPDWYDEPNPQALHLIGRYVRDRGFDRRPATTSKPPSLRHRLLYLGTPDVPASAVVEAARDVIA